MARTRWVLIVAAAANVGLCLWFRNVERLWIFMTAVLVCTCLVPVLATLFLPTVRRLAGAVYVGFGLVLAYYLWVDLAGAWVEAEAAYIWTGTLAGTGITLHQDYGMLYILPLVLGLFATLQWLRPGSSPGQGSQ